MSTAIVIVTVAFPVFSLGLVWWLNWLCDYDGYYPKALFRDRHGKKSE